MCNNRKINIIFINTLDSLIANRIDTFHSYISTFLRIEQYSYI